MKERILCRHKNKKKQKKEEKREQVQKCSEGCPLVEGMVALLLLPAEDGALLALAAPAAGAEA